MYKNSCKNKKNILGHVIWRPQFSDFLKRILEVKNSVMGFGLRGESSQVLLREK